MNIQKYILGTIIIISVFACKKDDDGGGTNTVIVTKDRGEQAKVDDAILVSYLKSHFYNYEEFETSGGSFDYKIKIDTITEATKDKISLFDQVVTKKITYRDVEQNLYTLQVRKGIKGVSTIADSIFVTYRGQLLNGAIFDSAVTPTWFDLPGFFQSNGQLSGSIEGFRQGLNNYGGAQTVGVNPENGNLTYSQDFGIGAVFIPSGLAYFESKTNTIGAYSNLIFTFNVITVKDTDHDRDHVPSIIEDLNKNNNLYDDDTDSNGRFNYLDSDDDGDGTATKDEDLEPDTDLTVDRDGDGDPTNDIGDGDPTNDDTDGDGIPNYLDTDDIGSRADRK